MRLSLNWKKTTLAILFCAVSLLLISARVSAADTWVATYNFSGNDIRILTYGNGIAGDNFLRLESTSGGFYTFSGAALYLKDSYGGDASKQCYVGMKIVVASQTPQTGTAYISPVEVMGGDYSSCAGKLQSSFDEAKRRFDQKTITLGNPKALTDYVNKNGGGTSIDNVIGVVVVPQITSDSTTLDNQLDDSNVPASDTITLKQKDGAGKIINETTYPAKLFNILPESIYYSVDIPNMKQGVYDVCSKVVNKCAENVIKSASRLNVRIEGDESTAISTTKLDSSGNKNTCESRAGPFAWIGCSLMIAIDSALRFVDNKIEALLDVSNQSYNNPSIKAAWSTIRNIAYVILIPIMLVMVLGTALGFEFVSAYTVKRALPRLVIAAIFISISYPVCVFLIELFNAIGAGTKGLLTAPFAAAHGTKSLTLETLFSQSAFQALIVLPTIAAALILLIFFGGTLLLFAGLGFLVLLLRQMFIIGLLLIAPLAILAWIFPGNDRLWKSWWGLFSKLLIMFPLIMGLIAVGRIFAFIIHGGGADVKDDILQPMLTLGAYMLPYAFIPFTFRFAGGLFATVAGFANDKSKGLFDRQKQWRGRSWAGAKAGEGIPLLRGAAGSRRNRIAQRIATPTSLAPGRFGARARSRMSTAASGSAIEGAKMLQAAGLLDDTAGNEFIQHGTSLGQLQSRVRELRASGKGDLADQLSAYAQFAGNRQALLGAMKLNAGFGKLADGSLRQLDTIFGDTAAERAAKQAAFGDLIFTSKGAGNYATYAARIKNNKVLTMSDTEFAEGEGRLNMAKAMMDAGPNVLSSIKPYTDNTVGDGYNTKELTARAVADGIFASKDGFEAQRAIESLAMGASKGAYNDPKMKAAFDRAVQELNRRSSAGGDLAEATIPVEVREAVVDDRGRPTGATTTVTRSMNPAEYYEYVSSQLRGGRDPRFSGLIDTSGGPAGPIVGD
jgi:hypothetical protein